MVFLSSVPILKKLNLYSFANAANSRAYLLFRRHKVIGILYPKNKSNVKIFINSRVFFNRVRHVKSFLRLCRGHGSFRGRIAPHDGFQQCGVSV